MSPETAVLSLHQVKEKWYQVTSSGCRMNGVLNTSSILGVGKES